MKRRNQYVCVLAGLLICLALTFGLAGAPRPIPQAPISGGDDIPFPTRDVPTWDTRTPSARARVSAPVVPEGIAVLLAVIVWTACRTVLLWLRGHHPVRWVLGTFSRRRSYG